MTIARDFGGVASSSPASTSTQLTVPTTGALPDFRSLRVDIASGGNGTVTFTPTGGGSQTWNVSASEIMPLTSQAMSAITAVSSGVTLFALN